jgi:hypothetical protein
MRFTSLILVSVLCLAAAACGTDKKAPVTASAPGSATLAPASGQLPPGHPPIGGMQGGQPFGGGMGGGPGGGMRPGAGMGGVKKPAAPRGKAPLGFTVPDGWKAEQPSSSMRIAQFRVPGTGGQTIECKVFGGIGGGADGNISRWVGQFRTADGGLISDEASVTESESNGLRITTLDVSGVFNGMGGVGSGDAAVTSRMLASEIEGLGLAIQVQLVGPVDVVAENADRFHAYVASFAPTE